MTRGWATLRGTVGGATRRLRVPARAYPPLYVPRDLLHIETRPSGDLLLFGYSGWAHLGLATNGTIASLSRLTAGSVFVNSSMRQFADAVDFVGPRIDRYPTQSDPDDVDQVFEEREAASIRARLETIDPPAVAADTFWDTFIWDVTVGDWSRPADRAALGFEEAARRHFAFLVDLGYQVVGATDTLLRFEHAPLFVNVSHGLGSFELGVELGRIATRNGKPVDESYPVGHLATVIGGPAAQSHHSRTALTAADVDRFVAESAAWLAAYGGPALEGDGATYEALRRTIESA